MIDPPLKINGFVDGESHITKDRYMFPFIAFCGQAKNPAPEIFGY